MKRIMCIFFFLLSLGAVCTSAETIYTVRTVSVFSSPQGQELGRIYAGTAVNAGEEQSGFRRIKLASLTAYAEADAFSADQGRNETQTAQALSPYGTETLILRDKPSDSCSTIGVLRAGETVRILGSFNGFCFVQSKSGSGFLSLQEIK